jgi:chromosomal replication initiator protein DnaA
MATPQDLLLPEGKLIRTTRGGTTILKQLLLDLKKYSFSGYVRTVRTDKGARGEGVVLLRAGNPEASLHQRAGARMKGRAALKQVWQDSYDEACVIELHARVDMDGLVSEYADAVLERPAKVLRKPKVPQPVDRRDVIREAARWKNQGYDVSSVESLLDGDPAALTIPFLTLKEAIARAEAVARTLDELDATGFEDRAKGLREKLREPLRHPELDTELEALRDAIERSRQVEARREFEEARAKDSEDRAKKVVQIVVKHKGIQAEEAATTAVAKAVEGPRTTQEAEANLVDQHTFDAFVVGPSNRFAHAAAVAAAKPSDRTYNPLLITSGPGLGKTHLLHAIGNQRRAAAKDRMVLYLTSEAFATLLAQAKKPSEREAFRAKVRGVDCLLLDDIQFLSGKPEVQEELFHTFNALHGTNRQIVMASDRPPKAIPDLDARLVSRFESGLVADIQAPDRGTRIAILESRARAAGLPVPSAALAFIADLVEDNVRELTGALNRVAAFSSLMDRPITEDLAKEVLRDLGEGPPPPSATVPEEAANGLVPGRSYLVEEERPVQAFRLLAGVLAAGHGGMVITRTNPRRVRETFALTAERVLWLTDREGSAEDTIEPALERIVYEIDAFFSKRPGSALLLDGLEYLVSNNSFEAVLKFVRRVVDSVSEGRSILLISLSPPTLKDQEVKMLEREMEVLRVDGTRS